jgi:hypothetical protein
MKFDLPSLPFLRPLPERVDVPLLDIRRAMRGRLTLPAVLVAQHGRLLKAPCRGRRRRVQIQ